MTPRSLDDWLAYISAQHPSTIALGLDRVRSVIPAEAGIQPKPAKVVITVGGTNGKGSTCAILERILLEAGYRVGLYTSPHLLRYNERVRVQGEEASDAALVESFERVEAARGHTPLTYFEFGTLAALDIFGRAKLDALILEVGLGGRLDAVNIVDADVAAVVSVDLDHQAYLGNDRESIGFEKAGIYRAGRPAICGDANPPKRLVEHAESIGADLLLIGRDFRYEAHDRQWDFIGRHGAKRALPMPALRGRWQLANASVALAALDELRGASALPVSLGEVKRALATVTLPARLQVLPGRPSIVLDVAHNPHAARALADGLGDMGFYERTFAVFAMLGDKDIGGVIDAMKGRIDDWYVSAAVADRAAPVQRVAELLAERGLAGHTRSFATVEAALAEARRNAGPNDRIIVFGSFHTVAEAMSSVR
ncbi:MAG TPA: bifunctional tetrahydrofolate synthase/dihydrofolate synthase [Usitatibacter sp.]|nr:bifunctional tetrahydrofolate synthase/dihydrofolate synthase [Usitatibacter sp.]